MAMAEPSLAAGIKCKDHTDNESWQRVREEEDTRTDARTLSLKPFVAVYSIGGSRAAALKPGRRHYNARERSEVANTRRHGACGRCKTRRVKCLHSPPAVALVALDQYRRESQPHELFVLSLTSPSVTVNEKGHRRVMKNTIAAIDDKFTGAQNVTVASNETADNTSAVQAVAAHSVVSQRKPTRRLSQPSHTSKPPPKVHNSKRCQRPAKIVQPGMSKIKFYNVRNIENGKIEEQSNTNQETSMFEAPDKKQSGCLIPQGSSEDAAPTSESFFGVGRLRNSARPLLGNPPVINPQITIASGVSRPGSLGRTAPETYRYFGEGHRLRQTNGQFMDASSEQVLATHLTSSRGCNILADQIGRTTLSPPSLSEGKLPLIPPDYVQLSEVLLDKSPLLIHYPPCEIVKASSESTCNNISPNISNKDILGSQVIHEFPSSFTELLEGTWEEATMVSGSTKTYIMSSQVDDIRFPFDAEKNTVLGSDWALFED